MNCIEHAESGVSTGAAPFLQGARVPPGPPRWVFLLPIISVLPSFLMAELGPLSKATGAGSDSAVVWLFQTFIAGMSAILLMSAWGNSLCRSRWPKYPSSRMTLGAITMASCFGWTMLSAIEGERALGKARGEDLIAAFLILSLPTLGLTVPLLWHAILRFRRLQCSLWLAVGYLVAAVGLQCWGSTRTEDTPSSFLLVNSLLIALAVIIWLIVIGRPSVPTPSERCP